MRVAQNIQSINTLNKQKLNRKNKSSSMERLSSGLRINRAADDAAGLSISQKMRAQIRGLNQASRNAQDGISLIQTAESAVGSMTDITQRMRELCVQGANETLTDDDRENIQAELDELKSELRSITSKTEFNTKNLLDGSVAERQIEELVEKTEMIKKEVLIEKIVPVEKEILVAKEVTVEKEITVEKTILVDEEVTVDKVVQVEVEEIVTSDIDIDSRLNMTIPEDESTVTDFVHLAGTAITLEVSQNLNGDIEVTAKKSGEVIGSTSINYVPEPAPAIEWEQNYGVSGDDYIYDLEESHYGGGYVVVGRSDSDSVSGDVINNHGDDDVWVAHLSENGNIWWRTSIGANYTDGGYDIQQSRNDGYIITGYQTETTGVGNVELYVARLSVTGYVSWEKTFGGTSSDVGYSIVETDGSGFIVAGSTRSDDGDVANNHGGTDLWLVKLSSTGGLQWEKTYGGSGTDTAVSIKQTDDGGYIVAGTTTSVDGDVAGTKGGSDIWVMKLDADGNQEWNKTYGGSDYEYATDVQITSDGGYIFTGYTESSDGDVTGHHGSNDAWVVKLDSDGNIQWQSALGGSRVDHAYSIEEASDGGYIVAGDSISQDGDVTNTDRELDYWIVKLTNEGDIAWERNAGGSLHDSARDVKETSDGGFLVAGYTKSNNYDVSGNYGGTDAWVAKLSPTLIGQEYVTMDLENITSGGDLIELGSAKLEFVNDGQDILRDISITGTYHETKVTYEDKTVQVTEIIQVPKTIYETETVSVVETVYESEIVTVDEVVYETKEIFEEVTSYEKTTRQEQGMQLQVGANIGDVVTISIKDLSPKALGFEDGLPSINPVEMAGVSIGLSDAAINILSSQRSRLGAQHNALEHIISNVDNASERLQAAESRIADADMAKEMMNLTKANILEEATNAMMVQSNQLPNMVLELLK